MQSSSTSSFRDSTRCTTKTQAHNQDTQRPLPLLKQPPDRDAGHQHHLHLPALNQVLQQPCNTLHCHGLLSYHDTPKHLQEHLQLAKITLVQGISIAHLTAVPQSLHKPDQPHMSTRGCPATSPGTQGSQQVDLPIWHQHVLLVRHLGSLSKTPLSQAIWSSSFFLLFLPYFFLFYSIPRPFISLLPVLPTHPSNPRL